MDRNVHGVVKNVNVNTLENVKGIGSHFHLFTMLLYITFKKISENSEN